MNNIKFLLFYISICLFSAYVNAQHNEDKYSDHHSKKIHDDGYVHAQNHVNKHHISLFGGMTTNLTHQVNLLTFGLDYEYRLPFSHNKFGIGLNAEFVTEDNTD